jgi:hypothetical protein
MQPGMIAQQRACKWPPTSRLHACLPAHATLWPGFRHVENPPVTFCTVRGPGGSLWVAAGMQGCTEELQEWESFAVP